MYGPSRKSQPRGRHPTMSENHNRPLHSKSAYVSATTTCAVAQSLRGRYVPRLPFVHVILKQGRPYVDDGATWTTVQDRGVRPSDYMYEIFVLFNLKGWVVGFFFLLAWTSPSSGVDCSGCRTDWRPGTLQTQRRQRKNRRATEACLSTDDGQAGFHVRTCI